MKHFCPHSCLLYHQLFIVVWQYLSVNNNIAPQHSVVYLCVSNNSHKCGIDSENPVNNTVNQPHSPTPQWVLVVCDVWYTSALYRYYREIMFSHSSHFHFIISRHVVSAVLTEAVKNAGNRGWGGGTWWNCYIHAMNPDFIFLMVGWLVSISSRNIIKHNY